MASKKPSGLGRGLGALLGDDVMNADAQTVTTLPIAEVESNSAQPRKYFDNAALAERRSFSRTSAGIDVSDASCTSFPYIPNAGSPF